MFLSIVRHGQTTYNASGLVQGRIDIPLTDLGKAQAKELGQQLKLNHEHYDYIMASSLSRAYESAKIIAKELGFKKEVIVDSDFVERDFHHLDGTPVVTAMPLVRSKDYAFESYETDVELISRIKKAVEKLEVNHANDRILLVAHSHVIKALMIYSNKDKYTFADLIKHADVIHFEIHGDDIKVIEKK